MSSSTLRLRADSVDFIFNAVLVAVDVFGLGLGVGVVFLDTSSFDSFAGAAFDYSGFFVFDGTMIFFLVEIFFVCFDGDLILRLLGEVDSTDSSDD